MFSIYYTLHRIGNTGIFANSDQDVEQDCVDGADDSSGPSCITIWVALRLPFYNKQKYYDFSHKQNILNYCIYSLYLRGHI